MSISLEHLVKSYGNDTVIRDFSDVVPDGSLTALLGPSGSGKSTLLKMIAGLESLDDGRIVLHGRDVTNVPARHRNIGFCFQDYAPFYQLSVFENVAYGLRVRKMPKDQIAREVEEMLRLVRLDAFADRFPRQLSGGQRQRMALARALAIKPDVLLLDEPFAALDAQVGAELRLWVRSLQRELGITTILVTHNQSEAMEVADRVVIMNNGQIEQVGVPAEVYDRPSSDFVHSFLGPTTYLEGRPLRPHDVELVSVTDGQSGIITDVIRLGLEVRVVVTLADGSSVWAQLTHDDAQYRNPSIGESVGVRRRVVR